MEADISKDDVARRHVNKVPVYALGWKACFSEQLENHVVNVNLTTTDAYMFSKWIFIRELRNPDFPINKFITQNFFSEVFSYLCERKKRKVKQETQDWRTVIEKHLDDFKQSAGIGAPLLKSATDVAKYEATTMMTAYTNNIVKNLGKHLNRAVNCILEKKQMERTLRNTPQGPERDAVRLRCEENVWKPARQVKEAFVRRNYADPALCEKAQDVLHLLEPVLNAYAPGYEFAKDSRFLDVTRNPEMHFRAFYELAKFFECKKYSGFICFPLRTSWVPAHTTITTDILRSQILAPVLGEKEKRKINVADSWSRVLNLQSKALQSSGGKSFSEVIVTDAVSACPIFENAAAKVAKGKKYTKKSTSDSVALADSTDFAAAIGYSVSAANFAVIANSFAAANPIAAMISASASNSAVNAAAAVDAVAAYYTAGFAIAVSYSIAAAAANTASASYSAFAAKFAATTNFAAAIPYSAAAVNSAATAAVYSTDSAAAAATAASNSTPAADPNNTTTEAPATTCRKSQKRAEDIFVDELPLEELQATKDNCVLIDPGRSDLLYCMHEKSTADDPCLFRYSALNKAKETRSRRFRKIRENAKKTHNGGEVLRAEARLSRTPHKSVNPLRFRRYVEMRCRVSPVLRSFYEDFQTSESSAHQVHKDSGGFKLHRYPLHRKLRLSAYINQQQADARLAKNLHKKFGADPVLVIGNWSAPNARFHAPIRGVGLRDMLRAHGFKVYLIDEYRTSATCPACLHRLEKFRWVDNPRPWRQRDNPRVLCNGLLRCTSNKCSADVLAAIERNADKHKTNVDSIVVPAPTPKTEARAKARAKAKKKMQAKRRPRVASSDNSTGVDPCRIWNRDLAAVLNMRTILHSLRGGNGIPEAFKRGNSNALAAPQPRRTRVSTRTVSATAGPSNSQAKRTVSDSEDERPLLARYLQDNPQTKHTASDSEDPRLLLVKQLLNNPPIKRRRFDKGKEPEL